MKITFYSNETSTNNQINSKMKVYHLGITPYIFTMYDETWKLLYCEKVKKWNQNANIMNIETKPSNPLVETNHINFKVKGYVNEKNDEKIYVFDNAMKIIIKNI
jgi:hypothetical protein